ncbi:MAG: NADP-specific glutamate dehydrogenase [Micavibrio sp.]|nr:NADP-specific glutamate dehydrogenase [Micavibrio sp.]|tara:strand:+ start:7189 stop:8517 length:1329 start_codon:yes stop_codon:yes gene_type:complete
MNKIIDNLKQKYPSETQFHQAVTDVLHSISSLLNEDRIYAENGILERLTEPDRIIQFRVTWMNEDGEIETNRGWRVQYNNAMGPYKGGLRFHPNVSLDTFKFLGFEQTFKNALTGLQMGGAKGGSDFSPKGRSDNDILRFCQAFMMELYKHIGPDTDIPAGDIGVGEREIGYLFGTYKKMTDRFDGALTGKNPAFGGSCMRKEATGYGCVFFLEQALKHANEDLKGQVCAISGAGNVALYTAKMLLQKGAKVISFSDSKGMIHIPDGISEERLEELIKIKEVERGNLSDLCEDFTDCDYFEDKKPWDLEYDIAIPCATQNEIDEKDANSIKKNNVKWVCEAANMPLTDKATNILRDAECTILPAKAVNAGGVAVSGLERTQNAQYLNWDSEKVCSQLKDIMSDIHALCAKNGKNNNSIDYINGSNIAGFKRVAKAMIAYGTL